MRTLNKRNGKNKGQKNDIRLKNRAKLLQWSVSAEIRLAKMLKSLALQNFFVFLLCSDFLRPDSFQVLSVAKSSGVFVGRHFISPADN